MFITGYSIRCPDANSIPELYEKLRNKQDLVSQSKRYPSGYHGLPDRAGHLKEIDKFDSQFFKLNKLHVEGIDPQIRMLLEVAYEAIVDGGSSIAAIKGTNTGVYVGHCFSDYHNGVIVNINSVNGYENLGSANSMAANKISYFFDLHGPSFTVDTACSSSLVALDRACSDISSGIVDQAIVAGVSLNLRPTITKVFQKYNMVSPTGTCHSFDADADGYCRSETVGALLIQSEKVKKSGYAKILAHGVNTNGNTPQGITYPSIKGQSDLIENVCNRFHIDKQHIEYIETHGTGTTAGDNVEINALNQTYGTNSRTIAIGAIKSNLGHAEGASAIASIIKCLLMFETGQTLPNLHYNIQTTPHEPLINKRFRVITEVEPFNIHSSVAINNFGFGGVNAHVILSNGGYNYKKKNSMNENQENNLIKKSFYVYGRTYNNVLNELEKEQASDFFIRNIADIDRFPFRGLVSAVNTQPIIKKLDILSKRNVAFVYSGQGSQYHLMGQSLLKSNKIFEETIHRLDAYLNKISCDKINLLNLFVDGKQWDNKKYSGIGIISIQIALTNMLFEQGFQPDFVLGHSLGEIACSYADGCLTEEQCMAIAFIRSELVMLLDPDTFIYMFDYEINEESDLSKPINSYDKQFTYRVSKSFCEEFEQKHINFKTKFDNHGAMLFISMLAEDAEKVLLSLGCSYTTIACYNSVDGLTLSGPMPEIQAFSEHCKQHSVFHRLVDTDRIAYHSLLLMPYTSYLVKQLEEVIPIGSSKSRSTRWISTSDRLNQQCDANYHVKNIIGSVYFHQAVQQLPPNCVVVEVSPHNGLIGQMKRSRPDIPDLFYCMSNREIDSDITFSKLLDNFWLSGVTKDVKAVDRLPIDERYRFNWDHEESWKIVTYKDFEKGGVDSVTIKYDLNGEYRFLLDHVIQSQALFPAMGHVYTIWRLLGVDEDLEMSDFQIYRAISIGQSDEVAFEVFLDKKTNLVEIFYDGEKAASAIASSIPFPSGVRNTACEFDTSDEATAVSSKDVYRNFQRYEYNYVDQFQVIEAQAIDSSSSQFKKSINFHWINYLDGLLQCSIGNVKALKLPTSIKKIQLKSGADFPLMSSVRGVHPNTRIVSDVGIITGLETTLAPIAATKTSSIKNIAFIPYGVNNVSDPDITAYMSVYIRYCHMKLNQLFTDEVFIQYPHLRHLAKYFKYDVYDPLQSSYDDQIVFQVTRDIFEDPLLLTNPLLIMSKHPAYQDLYLKDILFSSSPDSLQTCIDILNENIQYKYHFLEVGTGTGGALRRVHPLVRRHIESYTASDISVINIEESLTGVKTTRWNINDPFPDEKQKFDVIFGSNSIHCASDMITSLTHICNALTDEGYLLLEEYVAELPIYLWGLDSFIWNTATDERDHGLWMSHERWMGLFSQLNLELIISFNNNATTLYLLRKRSQVQLPVIHRTMNSLIAGLECGMEALDLVPGNHVIVSGHGIDGSLGFTKSLVKEPDMPSTLSSYLLMNYQIDTCIEKQCIGIEKKLLTNLIMDGQHGSLREISKVDTKKASNWSIHIDKPGFLNSFSYRQRPPGPVEVKYVGLNFKDVMLSYGKLKLDIPITLGIEFSAICDGSEVMGIGPNCLSKTLDIPSLLWKIPSNLSLQEAATIPCVYATVYYCLDHCAKITAGQSILIHAGAGGIGQAAIHVCLQRGCIVYTTCSDNKRQFLKQKFNLGDDFIGSSRDVSFVDWIMASTDYRGVDVVLNSLSEEKLLASLECVAKFGHFCEIGKYDIMRDNKIGLKIFANNISFHGVDISEMIGHTKYNSVLHGLIQHGLDNGEIVPINVDRIYTHSKMEDAVRYMGSGVHQGKILIDMSEPMASSVPIRPMYTTTGTHIITGGLGGFGLELAQWLVQRGAHQVLLLTRTQQAKTGYQRRKLHIPQLKLVTCDVTVERDVEEMLRGATSVTGIWHLAMLLQDALFCKMTTAQWKACVQPKIDAALYLDRHSRRLCPELQDFVMFSSISSLYGNAGQTNYAYANACMETLGLQRARAGLSAKVICWGRIGNVGYVANKGKVTTDERVVDQHIDSCLEDLHTILNGTSPLYSCYKEGQMTDQSISSVKATCLDTIARVLGLDTKKLGDHETLSDLGVDSLQVVTIRSILKNKGSDRTVAEIYQMKVGEIKHLD